MQPVWINRIAPRAVEDGGPLAGLTYAVKDNIDVAGAPTTAGCPGYTYTPTESAFVVERLDTAGAMALGKTNMDQFATGLVGTRSPYGACQCVFDERYISGGSSSGSAVAVALGVVDFALGTDTAGSGSGAGGVQRHHRAQANARTAEYARRGAGVSQPGLREHLRAHARDGEARVRGRPRVRRAGPVLQDWRSPATKTVRFGVLAPEQREFFGDEEAAALYDVALQQFEPRTAIDFTPLHKTAQLLYSGPWVAERLAAIQPFFEQHADEMDPVVREVIGSATRYSAVDAFNAHYELASLKRQVDHLWRMVDALVLPTAPTIYAIAQVAADPFRLNANLGYYTNFVNLLDMSALAVPAGFRSNGLPFGISLIGPAFADTLLLEQAERYLTLAGT